MQERLLHLQHRVLYAAFDRFPSAKGAAVHIDRFSRALFDGAGGGLLVTLGDETLPAYQREGGVEILRLCRPVANFLERTLAYTHLLRRVVDEQRSSLRLCHFRDPWGGVAILEKRSFETVYEINGLPSIELPHAYGRIAPETLAKIRRAEAFCWSQADAIVTPSKTLKENLIAFGVDTGKIRVIPNGADLPARPERPLSRRDGAPWPYLIYFGALQRWQGVEVLLKAFARLADLDALRLVICASAHSSLAKPYRKLAERLGIAERVVWFYGLAEEDLAPWRAQALLSVAPLTECPRNLQQGCCPLKILESMAAGVPVVASDLPSVRELITDGVDGRLVRPDRPSELARAIRVLLEYPDVLREAGERGRARIEKDFTWERSTAQLRSLYCRLCPDIFAATVE